MYAEMGQVNRRLREDAALVKAEAEGVSALLETKLLSSQEKICDLEHQVSRFESDGAGCRT